MEKYMIKACCCSVSAGSNLIFFYIYLRNPFIRSALGMKQMLMNQVMNFLKSISELASFLFINSGIQYCFAEQIFANYFVVSQSVWIGLYFLYLYNVAILKKPAENLNLFRGLIIDIFISLCLTVEFVYYVNSLHYKSCNFEINDYWYLEYISTFFTLSVILVFSLFVSAKLYLNLIRNIKVSKSQSYYELYRLLSFPFITLLCIIPALMQNLRSEHKDIWLLIIAFNFWSIGTYNFLALLMTKEFRTPKNKLNTISLMAK